MKSAGANQLIEAVEKTTGFKVVVDTVDGISEDAQMISARPEMPIHSIRVSKTKLPYADYIVAIQCAMLIRLWSNPKSIPVFSPNCARCRLKFRPFATVERNARIFSTCKRIPWRRNYGCHRTQSGKLHEAMKEILPGAGGRVFARSRSVPGPD